MRVTRKSFIRGMLGVIVVLPGVVLAACGGGPGGIFDEPPDGGPTGWVGGGGYGAGGHDGGGPPGDAAKPGDAMAGDGSIVGDGSGGPSGDGAAGDGGIGIVLDEPPGFFLFLDWSITGPASYSGRVYFGDAHSLEFVVGGVMAGDGYTITLSGIGRDGFRCSGTSAPFAVRAGEVTGAGVVIECPVPVDGATVAVITLGVGGADASH